MSTKINLYFADYFTKEIKEKLGYPIVRLLCLIALEQYDGSYKLREGIIDTGGHTSVFPFFVWKDVKIERTGTYEIEGITRKPECKVPAIKGRLSCVLMDEEENRSNPLDINALLALTDDVPLIIGFKDILSRFKVCFDYQKKEAYIEVKD